MIFVRIGNFVAWALLLLGGFRIAMAVSIAAGTENMTENAKASAYLLGAATTGEAINEATIGIGVGIVIGILAHIGRSLNQAK